MSIAIPHQHGERPERYGAAMDNCQGTRARVCVETKKSIRNVRGCCSGPRWLSALQHKHKVTRTQTTRRRTPKLIGHCVESFAGQLAERFSVLVCVCVYVPVCLSLKGAPLFAGSCRTQIIHWYLHGLCTLRVRFSISFFLPCVCVYFWVLECVH